jgi:hypothetical protein
VIRGYIPAKDEPGPDEILEALRESDLGNPQLNEMPSEEVARQLVLDGHLEEEPSLALVAEMLEALDAEEGSVGLTSSLRRATLLERGSAGRVSRT